MKPDFEKMPEGLVPVVVQDDVTRTVLMLGYMNSEAFEKTQRENRVTFYSRSKKRLWTKGETSGNFLDVKSMHLDCDADALLIKAVPAGPVCHTGSATCWNEPNEPVSFIHQLEQIIQQRKNNPDAGSYTASLLAKGINKVAQKVGEEAVELVIEAKDNNDELFKNEAADLMYHYLVLLAAKGFSLQDVEAVLKARHGGN
jgi:phosphoribosyl-ATP pyrophosphohydrolase/phosphoribosyl-AMP cyclohydrolase